MSIDSSESISPEQLREVWRQRQVELIPSHGLTELTYTFLAQLRVHSPPNYLHSLRVALLADEMAENDSSIDVLSAFYGGSLHDVGKIQIPRDLLEAAEINNSDYKEIKQHAELGYQMLLPSHAVCAMIAGSHHRIGRSGYGLKPEQAELPFSLESKPQVKAAVQAVAIADYFDAAMTRRNADGALIKSEMERIFFKQKKLIPILFASRYAQSFYGRGRKH